MLRRDQPFRNHEISSFSLGSERFFFTVFGSYFPSWIRVRDAKVLRIQRIPTLSTGIEKYKCSKGYY